MKVSVHYYAAAKELAACEISRFEFAPESVPQTELRSAVIGRFPSLAAFLGRMRLAVNGDFVDAAQSIQDGDRVDVLPPVAGGSITGNLVQRTERAMELPGVVAGAFRPRSVPPSGSERGLTQARLRA